MFFITEFLVEITRDLNRIFPHILYIETHILNM